jgi:hypothetical protein
MMTLLSPLYPRSPINIGERLVALPNRDSAAGDSDSESLARSSANHTHARPYPWTCFFFSPGGWDIGCTGCFLHDEAGVVL